MGDEHVMANYFPMVVGLVGHQWLVSLPENHFDSWYALHQAFVKTSLLPMNSRATSTMCSASMTLGMNHCAVHLTLLGYAHQDSQDHRQRGY
jgi:hypothetical protein